MLKIATLISLIIGLTSPMIIFADEVKPQDGIKQDQAGQALQINQTSVSENHIRSLAASCAACHGTNGNSATVNIPSISSINKPTFIALMLAFRSVERPATVMHRHAKGLTLQEIDGLAEYFSKQPRQTVKAISPQQLSETYPN